MNSSNPDNSTLCKILFLEDHKFDFEMMLRELKAAGLNNISQRVSTKKEFLDALTSFNPAVIISDYSLPTFNGMHAFKLFKEQKINIPFILVTGALNDELAAECLSEGVDDFLLKSSYNRLAAVITRNLEIKRILQERERIQLELERKNEDLKKLLTESEKSKARELLTNREFEILCLIASGKSIKEIASQLFISPPTVATHRASILRKLDLKSNVAITRYVIQHNLIDPGSV